jgi:hypothetical protein
LAVLALFAGGKGERVRLAWLRPRVLVVLDVLAKISQREKARASIAALATAFVCIDTMAYLAMPAGRPKQTRDDFIRYSYAGRRK